MINIIYDYYCTLTYHIVLLLLVCMHMSYNIIIIIIIISKSYIVFNLLVYILSLLL